MKLLPLFLLTAGSLFAHENIDAGKQNLRFNMMGENINLVGQSHSNQYINFIGGKDKTRGISLGTSSNRIDNPNIFAGISSSYIKDYKNEVKTRLYSFDHFLGYKMDDNLFISNISFMQKKNLFKNEDVRFYERNFNIGAEAGHIYKKYDTVLYPHINLSWNNYRIKGKKVSQNLGYMGIGSTLIKTFNEEVFVSSDFSYNYGIGQSVRYDKKTLDKKYLTTYVSLGYKIDSDFMIKLGFNKIWNKNHHNNKLTIGMDYYF